MSDSGSALPTPRSPYIHQRLRVYHVALDLCRTVKILRGGLPRGLASIGDQLTRASQSVCLNLAEGAASRHRAVKLRHWGIVAGSASECAAALDLLEIEDAAPAAVLERARQQLHQATVMTLALMR